MDCRIKDLSVELHYILILHFWVVLAPILRYLNTTLLLYLSTTLSSINYFCTRVLEHQVTTILKHWNAKFLLYSLNSSYTRVFEHWTTLILGQWNVELLLYLGTGTLSLLLYLNTWMSSYCCTQASTRRGAFVLECNIPGYPSSGPRGCQVTTAQCTPTPHPSPSIHTGWVVASGNRTPNPDL